MNNDKNIRFLTKEEMLAVAGGHEENGEDCGFEHIAVTAPSYPPLSYTSWISHQNKVTYSGGGSIGGDVGIVEGSVGGNASVTGTDLNNDGIIDNENIRYSAYKKFMGEQGYAIP
ncbi:hypothetical protein CJF42_23040 [Pseudoalteromonas sp. NBT06-2]|uniref:hypothetical protein n=1 Tax=Pseudoalteromonas sp. NBT06-2 TaxID=2025950 RepID=UPI000BA7CAFF|nr:hypothetical protein [Pseudoalteromonas sp. NBT06-2]PAJ72100.1 hypothetical protein CJF42_23040 [Pseudoalteromonas sp. NBT06-2]